MKYPHRTISLSIVATIGVLAMTAAIIYLPFQVGNATSARSTVVGATAKDARGGQPLEKVLNLDGSLNLATGFIGSLDAHGYWMEYTPNGAQRFAQLSASDDDNWDTQFNLPGTNGVVSALAVSGSDIYAGGYFTTAGGVGANNIAKWDGSSWSALGSGVNNVNVLVVNGSDLYAGGSFTTAGGVSAIAKWDGNSWSALGSGVSGSVYALAVSGSDLYVGGSFSTAGGVSASGIAKWDGNSWSVLGGGVGGSVYALAVSGSDLYVGGSFSTAGGVSVSGIAKWDGSGWSALGGGVSGSVFALAVSGSDLYVGGSFSTAGGVSASGIAKWNGSDWSTLGSGVNLLANALAVSGSDLYVGGYFTMAGGVSVNRIAKWNGSSWLALGSGVSGVNGCGGFSCVPNVNALAVSGSDLYTCGGFTTAGGVSATGIAKWNGSSWSALTSGNGLYNGVCCMSYSVNTLAVSESDLYAGGSFTTSGGVSANYIAKWNGSDWSSLGSGFDYYLVYALAIKGSDLYAGGSFTTAGGVNASNIAKWNGSSWSALGGGISGNYVYALAVSGSDLYVGGQFSMAGGVSASGIAKWDGSNWSALGGGVSGSVYALAVSGSDLYVGGSFSTAGGVSASGIAKWDGSNWSALGGGVNGSVYALAVSGSDLYVGGGFSTAGGVSANRIAKWNGSTWAALGSGISECNGSPCYSSVYALAVNGSDLYVGGGFTTAGGVSANRIAKWNGISWSALGSGVNDSVYAIAVSGSSVYAGGHFTTAGGKPSSYFGRYRLPCTAPNIATQPSSQAINSGSSITFQVTATGTTLSYQWRKNGSNISGATGSSYTIMAATLADAGSYDVVVTNGCGATTSNVATLTVNAAVTITAPTNNSPVAGLVLVSVIASGFSQPPTVTCEVDGVQVSTAVCSINTAGSGTWDVTGLAVDQTHNFRVKATLGAQTVFSATISVLVKPLISGQLRVKDPCSASSSGWNIDKLPSGSLTLVTITSGGVSFSMFADPQGRFSSRNLTSGSETSIAQFGTTTYTTRAALDYRDHIMIDNRADTQGDAPPPNNILQRIAQKAGPNIVVTQGTPATMQGNPAQPITIDYPLPIFLHHGILSGWMTAWNDWASYLTSNGYIVFTPNHNYLNGSMRSYAAEAALQMYADLGGLFNDSLSLNYYIIAHSQGGVISRVLTYEDARVRSQLKRIYTLGTPHSGTADPFAARYALDSFFMRVVFNSERWYPGFKYRDGSTNIPPDFVFAIGGKIPGTGGLFLSDHDGAVYPQSSVFGISGLIGTFQSFSEHQAEREFPFYHTELTGQGAISCILENTIIADMHCQPLTACPSASLARVVSSDRPIADHQNRRLSVQSSLQTTTTTTTAPVVYQTLTLSAGQTQTASFPISSASAATFICSPVGITTTTSITTPSGIAITASNVSSYPNVTYRNDAFGQRYTVSSPQAGNWTIRVTAGSQGGTAYLGAVEQATWQLEGSPDRVSYTAAAPVILQGRLTGNFNGVSSVSSVTATVMNSAGATIATSTLFDDGLHNDAAAGDKVYGNSINAPSTAGSYQVVFQADGVAQGNPFRRQTLSRFDVMPPTHMFTGAFSVSALDTNGDTKFDTLDETIGLNAPAAGQYTVAADLFDSNGNLINHAVQTISPAAAGAQQAVLRFSLFNPSCSSFTSGLKIKNLSVADAVNSLMTLDLWTPDINITGFTGAQFGCIGTLDADLAVSISASPNPISVGNVVTYTATASNLGPNPVNAVNVANNLPVMTTLVSCAATNGGVCSSSGYNAALVTFPTLASGASATITLGASVSVAVTDGATLTMSSSVSAATTDTNTGNNTTTATTQVSNPTVPTIAEFSPASSSPGATVAISGTLFTGATSVKFNGTNAVFNVLNGNLILATVPAGATTGPLTVTATAGTATSASNFTACACSFNPTSQSFAASGGVGSVTVTASTDCNWAAVSNSTWIALVNAGGVGNSSFGFVVSPNLTSSPRTGAITIGGQAFNITQAACPTITVNPITLSNGTAGLAYSQNFMATGGTAPYSFSQSAGTLPPGLTLSAGGMLSGTPTSFGPFDFTVQATDANQCMGERAYNLLINPPCGTITVNPAMLANGFVGTAYNQTLTATGGTAPYSFAVSAGVMPNGLSLSSGGALTGTPTAQGTFNFTVKATDNNGCMGTQAYTVIISGSGLMFYPLAAPVRLLDTRASATAGCVKNNGPFANNETRTLAARTACSGIPANATAIIGNITVVPSGPGFLTLFPSDAAQPTVANSNFKAGEVTNNFFTVGLGAADGAFKIFTSLFTGGTNSEVIIDVTGYYAPPAASGLFYHALPAPVRLLQTFPGQTGCILNSSQQLPGTNDANANPALDLAVQGRSPGLPSPCNGIPNDAVVLVGNATTVFPNAPFGFGYLTIYPSDAARPTVASSNYGNNDIINGPFAVKLGADGKFKVYTFSTTHLVIDISGYYSASATDANGAGLLFNPLPKPMRLLETRDIPGFTLTGCYQPKAQIPDGTGGIRMQPAWGSCSDQPPLSIPNTARALVGNATVINPVNAGFGTFFPGDVGTAPTVATTNYPFPVVFGYNRHYYVGLSPVDGTFKILTQFTSDYIVDVSGYFAP